MKLSEQYIKQYTRILGYYGIDTKAIELDNLEDLLAIVELETLERTSEDINEIMYYSNMLEKIARKHSLTYLK